jgi:hypothetical protein
MHTKCLPPVENVHNYNTCSLATQSYYLPKIKTNYGKFNVRFQGPIVWNAIDFHVKSQEVQLRTVL